MLRIRILKHDNGQDPQFPVEEHPFSNEEEKDARVVQLWQSYALD